MRMELARMVKLFKTGVIDFEQFRLAAFLRKLGSTFPVFRVMTVIKALAVVEYRKKANNVHVGARTRSQQEPVEFHLVPMLDAVNVRLVRTIRESMFHYGSKVYHN